MTRLSTWHCEFTFGFDFPAWCYSLLLSSSGWCVFTWLHLPSFSTEGLNYNPVVLFPYLHLSSLSFRWCTHLFLLLLSCPIHSSCPYSTEESCTSSYFSKLLFLSLFVSPQFFGFFLSSTIHTLFFLFIFLYDIIGGSSSPKQINR